MLSRKEIKIMLIDDDEEDYILTRELLSEAPSCKYILSWASSYQSGADAIRENKHDVYLIDYRLGADNGLDLIEQSIADGSKTPMIIMTGQGAQEIDEKAMRIGAADYIVKGSYDALTLD